MPRNPLLFACFLCFVGCTADEAEPLFPIPGSSPSADAGSDGGSGPGSDAAPGGGAIGSACSCDADCPSDGSNAGQCVYGVCMTAASGECSSAGSTAECGTGSRCWGLEGQVGGICWPDCDSYSCAGACDSDGSCVPTQDTNCSLSCGSLCSCESASDCGDGQACIQGRCIQGTGDGPGPDPGVSCALPPRDCTDGYSTCAGITTFDPRTTPHYDDYPINYETAGDQFRSYLSKEMVMLLDYATAKVLCKTADWEVGNGGPLGLGDMSEANGDIPGTSLGPEHVGHPEGTHVNGRDIDVGYYQLGTANNRLRPICEHLTANGAEANHCTADPIYLDLWRHALFLGYVFESPITRVIGVDGKAGPMIAAAINELCATGWLSVTACNNAASGLAYETTNTGLGWYGFHHHHSHISSCPGGCGTDVAASLPANLTCREPGCGTPAIKLHPHRRGLRH